MSSASPLPLRGWLAASLDRAPAYVPGREELGRYFDPVPCEFREERRSQSGRIEAPDDCPVRFDAIDLELEEILERDRVAFHPLYLCDRSDAAGPVVEAVELHDQIERGGDVLPDRAKRQFVSSHQHHRL